MSVRNKRSAKAARRHDRTRRDQRHQNMSGTHVDGLVEVHSLPELADLAERGATLPCGCDAHHLLNSDGWQVL